MKYEETCYHLRLSDGIEWNLTAINGTGKWLDKLANIMRLEEAEMNHLPKIIFCHTEDLPRAGEYYDSLGYDYGPGKNTKGWHVYDNRFIRTWFNKTTPDFICEINKGGNNELDILSMWHTLISIYQRVQNSGGLPLHAALIELDGQGIILAASGGTGKSTSCRRLPDYWLPLCDDEVLVVFDQEHEYYRAHPFPSWSEHILGSSDKSWNVQYSVPIYAIFFLEQAEKDEVIPLGEALAAVSLKQSATDKSRLFWHKLDNETKRPFSIQRFHNACKIAKAVPSFTLRASLHGRFWEKIEKTLETVLPRRSALTD